MNAIGDGIEGYYRLHHRIYDATRWSFLFGRAGLAAAVARECAPRRILEVGCGTGRNLKDLGRRFPGSELVGVDLSGDMLKVAHRNLAGLSNRPTLLQQAYAGSLDTGGFDLVVFSYALSMFNPGWERAIDSAARDLVPGGTIAVVDFHDSPLPGFRRWMGANHVRMEAHLLEHLQAGFTPRQHRVSAAYGGLWRWFRFIGTTAHTT